jgi:hypothetical protein
MKLTSDDYPKSCVRLWQGVRDVVDIQRKQCIRGTILEEKHKTLLAVPDHSATLPNDGKEHIKLVEA